MHDGNDEPHTPAATAEPLAEALALQREAARQGFDWPSIDGLWDKLAEEIAELKAADSPATRREEVGDLLFMVVNLARHLGVPPAAALAEANAKFARRYAHVMARPQRLPPLGDAARLTAMEARWNEAKRLAQAPPPLLTERLRLRPATFDDAGFLHALLNTDGVLRFIGDFGIRDEAAACRWIENGPQAGYCRNGHGPLVVCLRETGEPIGLAGLRRREGVPSPDLGGALLPAHENCGYAVEAASAVLDDAWQRLGLREVLGFVQPENRRSLALLATLGFVDDGTQHIVEVNATLRRLKIAAPPPPR